MQQHSTNYVAAIKPLFGVPILERVSELLQLIGKRSMDCNASTWEVEAGRAYYEGTVFGIKNALAQALDAQSKRDATPYSINGKM